jgi:hypothetical protein
VGMSAQYKAVRSELRALDAASGALKARQFLVPEGTLGGDLWNSPALSPDGRSVLAASGNDLGFDGPNTRAMIAFDSSSLAILASHQEAVPNQDLDFGTTPVVFHDSSGRSLVGANQKNGKFYAYDLADISRGPVWERATGLGEGAMPAYDEDAGTGGTLFVVGDNGLLFGLDPASGADRWPPLAVGFSNGNVAAANGLVYTGGGAGNVSIVAADSGALLTVLAPLARDRTFSGVVVSGGTVYSVSGAYLNAWSATASGSPPPPNTSPRASVTLAIVPGPLTPGPDSRTPQTAHWRVVLTETAGVGGNVAFLNVSLRDLSSGARADPGSGLSLGEPEIVQRAGTNRIEPLGTLSLEESLSYTLRSGGQAVRLAAAIQFKDDNGHVVSATGEAQIQP